MRINNDGYYEYCRWEDKRYRNQYAKNIKNVSIPMFFQVEMESFRKKMLNGQTNNICDDCYMMEKHNKISGRQRQLLKIGVDIDNFEKSLISSPWFNTMFASYENGMDNLLPVDWQIDLGNYCNAGCLFCFPSSSSKLASEWYNLGLINKKNYGTWSDDSEVLNHFLSILKNTPNIHYLHFIGGETIITPAFKKILQALVDAKLNSNISIGFTTNLMAWDESINNLLVQFKEVHLGLSIETLNKINDYIRWPSHIENVLELMDRWLILANLNGWLTQLRITPTILSIMYLDTIFEYALQHNLAIESCDFLNEPKNMRINVLPMEYRLIAADKIHNWVSKYSSTKILNASNNLRSLENVADHIINDAYSYINYLNNEKDESFRLPSLVKYLKILEKNRNNTILDYLPEYEPILRSAGY